MWKEKSTEAVLKMLRDTRIGCISTRRVPPGERLGEEMAGSGDEGEEGGRASQTCNFLPFFSFGGRRGSAPFFCSFVCLSSFLCLAGQGRRGRRCPTMIGDSGLGQDKVNVKSRRLPYGQRPIFPPFNQILSQRQSVKPGLPYLLHPGPPNKGKRNKL